MGARDRFAVALQCASCGTTGTAHCSDAQFTLGRDPLFQVDKIEGAFRVEKIGRASDAVAYHCTQCGREAIKK
jgi:predicted RNA-binding Zn-ribbon protein involved in translation (DUF1610 family)